MKVLMVVQQFRPIVGGAEKQAESLAAELVRQGCEVEIVTGRWLRQTPAVEIYDGVRVRRIFAGFGIPKLSQLAFLARLAIFIIEHGRKYDVIHFHQALRMTALGAWVARKRGVPCLAKTGSSGVTSDLKWLRESFLGGTLLAQMRKSLTRLVCTSQMAFDEALAAGFPRERLERIPNGVVITDRAVDEEKPIRKLLYVGRLSHEKGVDILLDALALLPASLSASLTLQCLGDGERLEELRGHAERLDLGNRIEWVGMVARPGDYFDAETLFVLPSRSEGMSNALLEALAAGLRCVATRVGSNEELSAQGQAAWIIEPENARALAQGIERAVNDRLAWGTVQRTGWIRENYAISAVAMRYQRIYSEIPSRRV